jgi:hypothetical protein
VLEVADILDELKMIRQLIQTQREILGFEVIVLLDLMDYPSEDQSSPKSRDQNRQRLDRIIQTNPGALTKNYLGSVDGRLVSVLTEIDEIKADAESTHKTVSAIGNPS